MREVAAKGLLDGFYARLKKLGAVKCSTCGDYAIHTKPCVGFSTKFGGGGQNLAGAYSMELRGELDEIDAEEENARG